MRLRSWVVACVVASCAPAAPVEVPGAPRDAHEEARGDAVVDASPDAVVESPPVVVDQGTVVPAYGLPPEPMTPDASASLDAPVADATVDAQGPDVRPARPPRDPGAMMVRYGAPPPADFV